MADPTHATARAVLATLLPHLHRCRIDACSVDECGVTLSLATTTSVATCPLCGTSSHSIHSRYTRTLADLPIAEHCVRLWLVVRRFFCHHAACARRIFCERIPRVAPAYQRQTGALAAALQQIGLTLGGKAGARLATTLHMPTSWMTVLRRVRTVVGPPLSTPRVLGVDDWSWQKGRRWGTILVDLEQHRPIDLLPDRTAASLAAWLRAHPEVRIISRDRSGTYADGAHQGAPHALQVADRFHLVKNIGACLEQFLHRKQADLRHAARTVSDGAPSAPPTPDDPGSRRTRAQSMEPTRQQQRATAVQQLHQEGMSMHAIARTLHLARNTVRAVSGPPAPIVRRSLLTPYEPYLWTRWQAGCRNATHVWDEIKQQGFAGGVSIVKDHVAPWRAHGRATPHPPYRCSPRTTMWLLRRPDAALQPPDTVYMAALVARCPDVAVAQALTRDFITMLHARHVAALPDWLRRAKASGIREFQGCVAGMWRDYAAVAAAFSMEWNNRQVEGQVNRLKLLKRQGYGRAGFDLLRQRVLHAP